MGNVAAILDMNVKKWNIDENYLDLRYVFQDNGFVTFKIIQNLTLTKTIIK